MIFKTTEDGSLTNIFKELKNVQSGFDDLNKVTLRSAIKAFNNTSISVDDLSKKFGGLDDATISYLKGAQRGNATLDGLSSSMTSASVSAKALSVALNMLSGIAISLAIQGISWAVDELIVTLEEQNEKLDEAISAYKESETELQNINDELKTTGNRIDELNGKDNLTFTEQDELERLIKTNDELERKIFLLEKANAEAEKEVVNEAQNTYDKYTNNRTMGAVDQIDFYTDNNLLEGINWDNYKNDLSWLVAQYKNQQELLVNAQENGWTTIEEQAKSNLTLLEGYMSEASVDYQSLYDKISEISEVSMTPELETAKKDLNGILDIVAEILGYGGQRAEITFDDIWNSQEFSKTKTELETLAKEGRLDAEVLTSNKEYNRLLEETGATAEATAQHINALVEEMEKTGTQTPDEIAISTISSSIQQIATQLEPQFAKLGEAYQNIFTADGFTLDNVDNSMLEELRQSFAEIEEEVGVAFDATQLNDFFDALTNGDSTAEQVQQSFNDLATSYFYSTDTLEQLNETTADSIAKQLEELGVINAKEVVYDTLVVKTEALALQEQLVAAQAEATARGAYLNVNAFLNQAGATETARAYLFALVAEEQVFNSQELDTSGKIAKLKELAIQYGQTALAAKIAHAEEQAQASHTSLTESDYANFAAEVNSGINNIKIDFSPLTASSGKAGKDAGEAYKDAVEKELNDLDSVINAVGDLISNHIDHIQEQCDVAVDALERERDAIIDGLEDEKKALEDAVEAKQDQIDAIREAREERTAEIDLQKKEYELERLQNQRTRLVYSDEKGFHYEQDTSGIRDAKEAVDEAKEEIEILKIEKEISVLEDSIDNIDSKIEEVNSHYDDLIEQTEQYYQNLIDGLEAYKSRWEELGELKEQAEFKRQLEELGISSVDILNMSEEAFQAFKTQYVDALDKYLQATGEGLDAVADTDLTSTADSVSKVADATTQIDDEKVTNLSSAMEGLGDTSNLEALYTVFSNLQTIIQDISDTLNGVDKEGGLVSALNDLGNIEGIGVAGDETNGLIGKFIALKNAINDVTTAISGGAEGQNLPQGGAPTMQGAMTPSGSPDSGGTGGLKQAIKEQVEEATTLLPEEIAKFAGEEDSLEGAVQKVITKVAGASGEESGQEGKKQQSDSGEADPTNLKGAIQAQYEKAEEVIVPLEVPMFEQLRDVILECVDGLNNMVTAMQSMSEISLGGDMQFGLINFHSEGTVGKAFAKGTGKYKGLPHDEKNAMRSEYGQPELTVYPNGDVELTTQPTMSDLPKGTEIFNEEQTRRIMSNKGEILGKAFANGTDISTIKTPTNLPPYLRPIQEGDRMFDLMKKFEAHNDLIQSQIILPVNSIQKNAEMMARNISNVNNNNQRSIQVNMGDVICKGVTAQEVAGEIGSALKRELGGMYQTATQLAHTTR